jgi:hypothetical protein
MGANVNGKLANFLGGLYFVVILVIAVAAIPLMLRVVGRPYYLRTYCDIYNEWSSGEFFQTLLKV